MTDNNVRAFWQTVLKKCVHKVSIIIYGDRQTDYFASRLLKIESFIIGFTFIYVEVNAKTKQSSGLTWIFEIKQETINIIEGLYNK